MAFEIGIGTAVIEDGHDLSRYLQSANVTRNVDAVDNTRFDPANLNKKYREFLAGLQGGAISTAGCQPGDEADTLPSPTGGFPNSRAAHDIFIAPFTALPGNLALIGKALQSRHAVESAAPGMIGYAADYQMTSGSPGVASGVALFNPHGTDTVTVAELKTLVFTSAPTSQEFAIKVPDSDDRFVFTPAATNADLKTGIDTLLLAYGVTVTVTGSLTGTTTKSGTKTLTFLIGKNPPELEVHASESQQFTVADGDGDADYAINGCTPFPLGETAANIQAAVRATGGNYANVIIEGTTTAPIP